MRTSDILNHKNRMDRFLRYRFPLGCTCVKALESVIGERSFIYSEQGRIALKVPYFFSDYIYNEFNLKVKPYSISKKNALKLGKSDIFIKNLFKHENRKECNDIVKLFNSYWTNFYSVLKKEKVDEFLDQLDEMQEFFNTRFATLKISIRNLLINDIDDDTFIDIFVTLNVMWIICDLMKQYITSNDMLTCEPEILKISNKAHRLSQNILLGSYSNHDVSANMFDSINSIAQQLGNDIEEYIKQKCYVEPKADNKK